ncbi:MAG: hypothetical protein AAF333_05845 [Planctomycetota bacterium]
MQYRPHDRDLTFYLQVYRDQREAQWCLRHLRKHYPQAQVLMVSDGDDHPRWNPIAQRFGARYVAGQRLYGTEHGGRMIQRMLDLYNEHPTPYLIKIDTDTWTHRRLTHLPTGCKVFGTLEWTTCAGQEPLGFPNVQGGFVGYTREAIQLIRTSKLLISNRLQDYGNTYADVQEIRRRAEEGMVSFDFLTRYACRSLGIECVEFEDVKSLYRGWVPEINGQFAFTHPHKEVASRHPLEAMAREYLPRPVRVKVREAMRFARQALDQRKPATSTGKPAVKAPVKPAVAKSDAA